MKDPIPQHMVTIKDNTTMKRKETVSSQEMGTLLRKQQHPPPPDQWLPEGNFTENDSNVSTPKIPVGGRLKYFWKEWTNITEDKWVLSIIKNGYLLEFHQNPPFSGVKQTNVNVKNLAILNSEIKDLLEKGAIEPVPVKERMEGFYSTLFLVPKKSGGLRPVINLKPLNQYLRKIHFKMDTMSKVLNLVQKGDWGITLNFKDAYFHVPIHKNHRKYLRFCVENQCYQFVHVALCFGPTSAPRVFTKIVYVVAAHLRLQNVRLASYLDDWLAVNQLRTNLYFTRSRVSPRSPLQIRFPYKQRIISVNSHVKLDLHRGVFSVGQGHCISNSRKDIEPKDGNFQDLERSSISTRLSISWE